MIFFHGQNLILDLGSRAHCLAANTQFSSSNLFLTYFYFKEAFLKNFISLCKNDNIKIIDS